MLHLISISPQLYLVSLVNWWILLLQSRYQEIQQQFNVILQRIGSPFAILNCRMVEWPTRMDNLMMLCSLLSNQLCTTDTFLWFVRKIKQAFLQKRGNLVWWLWFLFHACILHFQWKTISISVYVSFDTIFSAIFVSMKFS